MRYVVLTIDTKGAGQIVLTGEKKNALEAAKVVQGATVADTLVLVLPEPGVHAYKRIRAGLSPALIVGMDRDEALKEATDRLGRV